MFKKQNNLYNFVTIPHSKTDLTKIPDSSGVGINEEQRLRISGNNFKRLSSFSVTRNDVFGVNSDVVVAVVSVERDDGRERFRIFCDFRKVDWL